MEDGEVMKSPVESVTETETPTEKEFSSLIDRAEEKVETFPQETDEERKERHRNAILFGRSIHPTSLTSLHDLPDPDTLDRNNIDTLNAEDRRVKTHIQQLRLPDESTGYYDRLHGNSHQVVNVVPDDQVKGIDIFVISPGHGSKDDYDATGCMEGTRQTTINCDFAVQKISAKNDCLTISYSYIKNETAQIHTYSTTFVRENNISLDFCGGLVDECFKHMGSKADNVEIDKMGSISLVMFYRKLKISIGYTSKYQQLKTCHMRAILEDMFNVVYSIVHSLEPNGLFSYTWKDPDTLEEQMKKQIALEDGTLDDGVVSGQKKQGWYEWAVSFIKRNPNPQVYVPDSTIDDLRY